MYDFLQVIKSEKRFELGDGSKIEQFAFVLIYL